MLSDFRFALRSLRKTPGFTAVAVLTVALGIGATTALFTVLYSVVLAPLPYDAPDELVALDSPVPKLAPDAVWGLSEAGYFHFKNTTRTLADLGAYTTTEFNLASDAGARRVTAALVSKSLLDVLRARPALGRLFVEEEDRPGGPRPVVLGHDFWLREFGGDSSVVGSTIELQTVSRAVVGVAAGFHLPQATVDVWLPWQLDPLRPPVNAHFIAAIGRLNPGFDVGDARREMAALTERLPELFPQAYSTEFLRRYDFTTRVRSLHESVVGAVDGVLWILLVAVGLVLVIAAVNVGNLFLLRTESRRREFAVRTAMGAGRGDLARQGLAEGLLLAVAAAVLALALADGGIRLLLALAPSWLPRLNEIEVGWTAAGFATVTSLVTGAAVGLLPLARARIDFGMLRDVTGGLSATARHYPVRSVLVVSQVALAVVLLAGAGLLLRSLERLRRVEPGLDPTNTVTFELNLPAARYGSYEAVLRFYRELVERVEALPGVAAVGAGGLPLRDFPPGSCTLAFVEDQPTSADDRPRCIPTQIVAPGYFRALGIPLRGTGPEWAETEAASAGAVVTAALARRLWPNEDPIGKGIRGNTWVRPFYRVVGVTGDLYAEGLDRAPTEAVFYPMIPMPGAPLWTPPRSMSLIVRTHGAGADELAGPVRRIVSEIDRSIPIGRVLTMGQVMARSLAHRSFAMMLIAIAAGMALALSVVGLYGVVAHVVAQRGKEIGIRMALGARSEQVAGHVLRDAMLLGGAGAALGVVGAFGVTRVLRSLLFEISPFDPVTLMTVTALVLAVTAAASLIPARRAARVDPMVALRYE
jgi:predicted permease